MNADDLLDVIGETSGAYLQDADIVIQTKRPAWIAWLAAAACLVVAVLLAVSLLNDKTEGMEDPENTVQAETPVQGAAAAINRQNFDTYDQFSAVVTDTVFEAFAVSEEAQEYDITYSVSAWVGSEGSDELISYAMTLSNNGSDVCVLHANDQLMIDSHDSIYAEASDYGIRRDYFVDSVEIQKYSERDMNIAMSKEQLDREPGDPQRIADLERSYTDESFEQFEERININGDWYYVYGKDESATDAVATTLAHIAAQMK